MKIFQILIAILFIHNCHGVASIEELLKAIERQDAKTLHQELKGRSFTRQEEYDLILRARQLVKEHDKRAWISTETKQSCLAMSCLALMGIGFACLGNLLPLGLMYDTKPGVEVSFFKGISQLDPATKKYLALSLLGGAVGVIGGVLSGYACMNKYFTHRSHYILNLIDQHISPYSVISSGDKEFICFYLNNGNL